VTLLNVQPYDQIWNYFETLANVGLAQARPNDHNVNIMIMVHQILPFQLYCELKFKLGEHNLESIEIVSSRVHQSFAHT